jgi:hypothetical protein
MRVLLIAAVLVGCGTTEPAGDDAPEPPTFDVAAVRASFAAECPQPLVVDALFCEQVEIDKLSADGDILIVPTLLAAAATNRARAICEQFATFHFDAEANDLGYTTIGILDRDGGNAAACSV